MTKPEQQVDHFVDECRQAVLQNRIDVAYGYADNPDTIRVEVPRMLRTSSINVDSAMELEELIEYAIPRIIPEGVHIHQFRKIYGEQLRILKAKFGNPSTDPNIEQRYNLEFTKDEDGIISFNLAIVKRTWHPQTVSINESMLVKQKPPEMRGYATYEEMVLGGL